MMKPSAAPAARASSSRHIGGRTRIPTWSRSPRESAAAMFRVRRLVDVVVKAGGFQFGHTHKAHPLACAVGLAVLEETLERRLIERAGELGVALRASLNKLK